MADPAYIDADGVLTDGEAWVALSTTEPTGTKLCQMTSPADGSSTDWSQFLDLIVIVAAQSAGTVYDGDGLLGYFNNDTSSNYKQQWWAADGSAPLYLSNPTMVNMTLGNSLSTRVDSAISTSLIWRIYDINSGKYKSSTTQWAAMRDVPNTWTVGAYSFVWQSQAAITEIDLNMENANYGSGCMISLFGILPRMVA